MNKFVFVVCGAKEHIDTLHYSLERLKKYSQNEIIVLTDSTRNAIKVEHSLIIDIETPKHFNHHQASIYLKTGIYKFLPKGNNYCYLDTDVIALNNDVDKIFEEFEAPVTFAPDHCVVKKFSPYAVFCGCSEKWKIKRDIFEASSLKHDKNRAITDTEILSRQKILLSFFNDIQKNIFKKFTVAVRYFMALKKFHLNEDFYFDKINREWVDKINGSVVLHEVPVKTIEKETGFKYNRWTQNWHDKEGNNIWQDECEHLPQFIYNKYKIKVNANWQHWNGGVFLFNDQSHEFLASWHKKTMEIFEDKNWRTRDQGTLIATANEFGLQNHKKLSKKWNFIADYYNKGIDFNDEGFFTDNFWKSKYKVNFIHVYHHWGDESWGVWRRIVSI
ncbi:MAG: hypothetical protein KDE33_25980 [Bacteroidetes bacterium]|nr:hypothetical protein [Bacteroidota bacterium]MCB9225561.1 hypothetical protein [Chitinophagales bacterium]